MKSIINLIEAIQLQATPGEYWVGAKISDNGNGFVWTTDGSAVDDDNWGEGFPDSDSGCVHMTAPDGYRRNKRCEAYNYYVCETNQKFSTPPNGKKFYKPVSFDT